jgi:hypothetical protein
MEIVAAEGPEKARHPHRDGTGAAREPTSIPSISISGMRKGSSVLEDHCLRALSDLARAEWPERAQRQWEKAGMLRKPGITACVAAARPPLCKRSGIGSARVRCKAFARGGGDKSLGR